MSIKKYTPRVPSAYQEITYIKANGDNAYIDTLYSPISSTNFELDFKFISSSYTGGTAIPVFAVRDQNDWRKKVGLWINKSNYYTALHFGSYDSTFASSTATDCHVRNVSSNDNANLYYNGNYITGTSSYQFENPEMSMYLFGLHGESGADLRNPVMEVYDLKIYEGNVLVRHYIPVRRKSDNEIGLYETETNAFMNNSGEGTLLGGINTNDWTDIPYRKYGTETETFTSLPKTIIGDGTALSAWSMDGNMQVNGTPTPQNPITPQETGDKTANLFNEKAFASIKVTSSAYRYGTSLGVLPAGEYQFTRTRAANSGNIYLTVRTDNTYNYNILPVSDSSYPYTITADGVSEYIIRTGEETGTTWADFGYTNMMVNSGSTALPYEPFGYEIPISLSQNTYNIYITEPLRKSLDGSNVFDTIESNGTLTRRVDANGDALATPTTEQVTVPTLTTTGTAEQFNVLTTLAPSEVSLTYHGWHEHTDTKYSNP